MAINIKATEKVKRNEDIIPEEVWKKAGYDSEEDYREDNMSDEQACLMYGNMSDDYFIAFASQEIKNMYGKDTPPEEAFAEFKDLRVRGCKMLGKDVNPIFLQEGFPGFQASNLDNQAVSKPEDVKLEDSGSSSVGNQNDFFVNEVPELQGYAKEKIMPYYYTVRRNGYYIPKEVYDSDSSVNEAVYAKLKEGYWVLGVKVEDEKEYVCLLKID